MSSRTIRFQPIEARRSHTGKCPVCGKSVRRSRTFEHTVSPFNRNADGSIRTPEEIRVRVKAEADAWQPDFTHGTCRAHRDKQETTDAG